MENNVEEISLREIVEVLLKGKKLIIGITLVAMIFSAIISFFIISPTYEVKSSLIVKQIKGAGSSSIIGSIMDDQSLPIGTLISAFGDIITGQDMLEQIQQISPDWENVSSETLSKIIKVGLDEGTTKVTVTVNANSAKDTVTLSNIVTKRFQEYIEEQNYDALAAKVVSVKRQLEIDMDLIKNRIAKDEQELTKLDKVLVYKKSIVNDPYLQELAARLGNTNVVNLSNLSVENEQPNPAYMRVLDNLTSNKLALSNLESQFIEIIKASEQLNEIVKETGMKASIIRDVIEPEEPIKPGKMLNIAIAMVLGFMLSVFYVFVIEYWRNSAQIERKEANH